MLSLWISLCLFVFASMTQNLASRRLQVRAGVSFKRDTSQLKDLQSKFKMDLRMLQKVTSSPRVYHESADWRTELFTFKGPFEQEELEAEPQAFFRLAELREKEQGKTLIGVPQVFLPFDFFRWRQFAHGSELNYVLTSIRMQPLNAFQMDVFKFDEPAFVLVRLYEKDFKDVTPLGDLVLLREDRAIRPNPLGRLKRESIRDLIEPPGWDRYTRVSGEDRSRYFRRRDLQSGHNLKGERSVYLKQLLDADSEVSKFNCLESFEWDADENL